MFTLIQNSTIHGLNHIYSATNRVSKCMWLFLFVVGISGIITNVVLITLRYLSNPVMVSQAVNHERFYWPDLTFCNPTSPFFMKENSSFLQYWIETQEKAKSIIKLIDKKSKYFTGNSFPNILKERTLILSSVIPQKIDLKNFNKHFLSFGFGVSSLDLFSSLSQGDSYISFNEKLSPLFSTQIFQFHNNIPCHTFQIEKSKAFKQNRVVYLKFTLKFNYDSYQFFNDFFFFNSIFLYITNKGEIARSQEIVLQPEESHIITISQVRYQHRGIKKPCKDKLFKIQLYDASLESTKWFVGHYKDCKKIQTQKLIVKKCNCYSPFLPIHKNGTKFPKLCLNMTIFNDTEIVNNAKCMENLSNKVKRSGRKIKDECITYRVASCDEIQYKIDHQKNNYLKEKSSFLKNQNYNIIFNCQNISNRICGQYFIELIVKQESQYGDLIKEELQYPFPQLLSDIGGLMGLWLGMSIIGLFEILEFVYIYILNNCNSNIRNISNRYSKRKSKTIEADYC